MDSTSEDEARPKRAPADGRSASGSNGPPPRPRDSALQASLEARCTPADRIAVPQVEAGGEHDLRRPEYFLNRELTWLNFNYRVLSEAADARVPLLERLKFIAIVGSNIDEFFMKRIGGLKQQVGAGMHELTVDGRTPGEQIAECKELVGDIDQRQRRILEELRGELDRAGVVLAEWDDLDEDQRAFLRGYYVENIYPLVTPQSSDPAHPFPFISNLSLNLLVSLRYPKDPLSTLARVKVPQAAGIPRFLQIGESTIFVSMESVMAANLDLLFPGMEIESCARFRVTRNANTEREEERADDLLVMIESELRDRKFAPIVRLQVSCDMPANLRDMLAAELGLTEASDVFESEGMLGMRDLMEIAALPMLDLRYKPHHPVDHPEMQSERSIFHIVREKGAILLHHPYVSFTTSVERFLREASRDPKVRAIKMSLYRTSADTKVISYLIDAARNGKQVAVVVELKARFDEEANIRWASRMEEVGIHVTYGVVGLKTHCKVILVVRQDYSGLRRYTHVGTGNYHAGNARLYSDLGMLTSDEKIGADLTELFNYLTTGFKPRRNYAKILPAPKVCKAALLERIEREVELQQECGSGLVQMKMNALEDANITRALYRASQAGVHIDLIVRDTCRLRPGIPGLSENIRVISIVGRFLEHLRLFYFRGGGDEEYFIGSADCMKRNLMSRVEVLAPVEDANLRAELRFLLDAQLGDRRSAWEMRADGSYVQLGDPGEAQPGCQERLIEWHERRVKELTRLKRRKARGIERRNVR